MGPAHHVYYLYIGNIGPSDLIQQIFHHYTFGHSILMSILEEFNVCVHHGIKLYDGIILLRLLTH